MEVCTHFEGCAMWGVTNSMWSGVCSHFTRPGRKSIMLRPRRKKQAMKSWTKSPWPTSWEIEMGACIENSQWRAVDGWSLSEEVTWWILLHNPCSAWLTHRWAWNPFAKADAKPMVLPQTDWSLIRAHLLSVWLSLACRFNHSYLIGLHALF